MSKVRDHVEDALGHGAQVLAAAENGHDPNRFAAPLVLAGATTAMRLANEETFGPVAPLFRFRHEEEAVEIANGTLRPGQLLLHRELHRAWRVAERLEFGMVGLNTGSVSMEMAPFGGVKQSGLGREGGQIGIDDLETKAFHLGGLKLG